MFNGVDMHTDKGDAFSDVGVNLNGWKAGKGPLKKSESRLYKRFEARNAFESDVFDDFVILRIKARIIDDQASPLHLYGVWETCAKDKRPDPEVVAHQGVFKASKVIEDPILGKFLTDHSKSEVYGGQSGGTAGRWRFLLKPRHRRRLKKVVEVLRTLIADQKAW